MTDKSIPFEGEHEAAVVHIVRCGRHTPKNDKYNKGSTPRLWVTYELLDDQNEEGNNRWMSGFNYNSPFNNYYTDKGAQADWVSTFTNSKNTDDTLRSILGAPCWVDVAHTPGKGPFEGRTFANFDGVSKWRKRDGDPKELMNAPVFFDFYAPVKEDYFALPFWIRRYMQEADDAQESGFLEAIKPWEAELQAAYEAKSSNTKAPEPKKEPENASEFDMDVPFNSVVA